ncbi:DNA polymerase III subunit epsilon [Brevundimonas halotolerans]|uniref:Exodeoxyribonuclease X n=1 Tax=Brevundimonas halotolerans TaxID=69670 RepID=A0A7W9A1A9_9CAUL|nr:DNA polymerase III subunit epsilon [Brevundimonas halotolerans]MBB5659551.1 exodeoxyribonuclease X [Brevundimonas halotolerans]
MSQTATLRVRVIDLETAGSSPSDVCEVGWQDVEQQTDGTWQVSAGSRGARFVDPGRPISPGTMAIHHILDEWVQGAGYWRDVAPAVLRPDGAVSALAAHRASFEQRFCTPDLTGSADWICTWKCALRLWPDLPRFSNQMLRYLRRPEGLDHDKGLPAHRALPDAYVTAHHLRDMLNTVSLEQLLEWSREPGLLPRVPSGAHRGQPWSCLSDTVLATLARDRDIDIRFSAATEIGRRGGQASVGSGKPAQPTLL